MESGTLTTRIDEKNIATLCFSHPASNSFPSDLLKKVTTEINRLSELPTVALIILKSEGKGSFCAGASFKELLSIADESEGTLFFSGFANVINAMRKCKKPIIGRIHGKAVGGGVGLAAACDYTFATSESALKLSELSIGIGPFVIEPAVSRKIGKTALSELALTPTKWKSAHWAKEKGLYTELFDSVVELDAELNAFSAALCMYPPEALTAMKKVFWEGTDHWDALLSERAAISGKLVLSPFTKNALATFKK